MHMELLPSLCLGTLTSGQIRKELSKSVRVFNIFTFCLCLGFGEDSFQLGRSHYYFKFLSFFNKLFVCFINTVFLFQETTKHVHYVFIFFADLIIMCSKPCRGTTEWHGCLG